MTKPFLEIDRTAYRLEAINQQITASHLREMFIRVLANDLPFGYPDALWRESMSLYGIKDQRFTSHTNTVGNRSISFEMLGSGEHRRNHEIAQLDKQGFDADQTQDVRVALETWLQDSTRTKKEPMVVDGRKYRTWRQAFVLVGHDHVHYDVYPAGIWKVHVRVLIPYANAPINEAYFPRVVIEFVTQALIDDRESPVILTAAVRHVISEALSSLSYTMDSCAEEYEGRGRYPCHLDISVPAGCDEAAKLLYAQYQKEDTLDGGLSVYELFDDTSVEVMRIRICMGSLVDQPAPAVSARASAPPLPTEPGDTFLLIETPLKSVTQTRQGVVQHTQRMQLAQEFENSTGLTPDNMLKNAGVSMQEVAKIAEYNKIMRYLEEHADDSGDDPDYLVDAVQYQGVQAAARHQPVFRLLLDLATGFHSIEYGGPHSGLVAFLDRAMASDGRMGKIPKRLKLSRMLTNAHPELEPYAHRHGIEITRPNSGADAGAKYVRQWNSVAENILHEASPTWWQYTPMSRETFAKDMERASEWFCAERYPDHLRGPYYLHCFLNISDENRQRYLAWRNA